MPDFKYEHLCEKTHLIAGIDEAGRGPWAGPVVAGAVIFPDLKISDSLAQKLDDSKKLTAAKREALFEELHASNALIGCGMASVEEIDSPFEGRYSLTIRAPKGSYAEEFAKENGFDFAPLE